MPLTLGDTVHSGTLLPTQLGSSERRAVVHASSITFPDGTSQASASGGSGVTQTDLDAKADLAGPTFTGDVILPTTTVVNNVNLYNTLNAKVGVSGLLAGDQMIVRNAGNTSWVAQPQPASLPDYSANRSVGEQLTVTSELNGAGTLGWQAPTAPTPPYWALNMGSANKTLGTAGSVLLDSAYFLGTGSQGGNVSSGVTMSNGVVTITTEGYYSLNFTVEIYQATATLIHVDQQIKYEAGGGTPSSASPYVASAMNIWTDIQYSQSTQEAVTSYANTLQVLRHLQEGSKLQCYVQTMGGSPTAFLMGNRTTHFSGFRVA